MRKSILTLCEEQSLTSGFVVCFVESLVSVIPIFESSKFWLGNGADLIELGQNKRTWFFARQGYIKGASVRDSAVSITIEGNGNYDQCSCICLLNAVQIKVHISLTANIQFKDTFASCFPAGSNGNTFIRCLAYLTSVRRSHCSNISETARPIKAKFPVEPLWVGGTKFCSRHLDHMSKMAASPIYGKNPSKIFSRTRSTMILKLGM